MTVLADFVHIVRPSSAAVDVPVGSFDTFNTGGRINDADAFLVVVARNLLGSALISINGKPAGFLRSTGPTGAIGTQMAGIPKDVLKNGKNSLRLTNTTDEFQILSISCFFHQNS
jgi:hypothetical protein